MGASAKERGGSFRDLRKRHLPLFKESVHRHDRGWPHSESDKNSAEVSTKKSWKRIGIFHFRPDEDEGG